MIRLLIFRLWPVFIPLIFYMGWMMFRRHKATKKQESVPGWMDGPWLWALGATVLSLVIGFFIIGLSTPPNSGTNYQPTEFIDGQLKDESLSP